MGRSACDIRYLSNPRVIAEELNKLYDWSPEYLKKRFGKYNFNTSWDVELYENIAYIPDRHLTTGFKVVKKRNQLLTNPVPDGTIKYSEKQERLLR